MTLPDAVPAAREAGAIYDLGYRGYDGPRLGRGHAISTLFWSSLRAAFGLGRSGRAKIVPWGLTIFAVTPAVVAVAFEALAGPAAAAAQPFTYDNYLWEIQITLALFVAAQGPELVNGDMRHRVLSLYFSHPLERLDYAAAKLGALVAALLVLAVVPQLLLFTGSVLGEADVLAALGDELGALPQIVGGSLLYAVTLAALALAIASFTPRRAYATGAIIAVFLVTASVSGILGEVTAGTLRDASQLINPFILLDGTRDWLLGGSVADSPVGALDLPVYGAGLAVLLAATLGALALRYRSIDA